MGQHLNGQHFSCQLLCVYEKIRVKMWMREIRQKVRSIEIQKSIKRGRQVRLRTIEIGFESNPNRVTFHAYRLRRKLHKVYYDETNLSGGTKSIQFRALQSILPPIMECLEETLNKGWRKFVANENPLKNFPKWLSWVYAMPSLCLSLCLYLSLPQVLPLFYSFTPLEMRRRRHRFFHVRPATDSRFASNTELSLELKSKFSAEHLSAADLISVTRRLGR